MRQSQSEGDLSPFREPTWEAWDSQTGSYVAPPENRVHSSPPSPFSAERRDAWSEGITLSDAPRSHGSPKRDPSPRPQWTPRTSAGRAKLIAVSENWEWADETRRIRNRRERYKIETEKHKEMCNFHEATLAREQRSAALQDARDMTRQAAEEHGRARKAESMELRRRRSQFEMNYIEDARNLHYVHNNERMHSARASVQREREVEARRRVVERQRAERFKARELSEHLLFNKARAQQVRSASLYGVRSSNDQHLQQRTEQADEIKDDSARRADERFQYRQRTLLEHRQSHNAVVSASSPSRVRDLKARLREEKAQSCERMRDELQRMHVHRLHRLLAEEERKRELHDSVRRAAIDGEGGGVDVYGNSTWHSPGGAWSYHGAGYSPRASSPRGSPRASNPRASSPRPSSPRPSSPRVSSPRGGGVGLADIASPPASPVSLPSARSPTGRWLREYAAAHGSHPAQAGVRAVCA